MAEVTSGTDLTVLILNKVEAEVLARLLRLNKDKPSVKKWLSEVVEAV